MRHPDGEDVLQTGDTVCSRKDRPVPINCATTATRPPAWSSSPPPRGSADERVYPDDGRVLIRIPGHEGLVFREADQIEDYWDGEPGAGAP